MGNEEESLVSQAASDDAKMVETLRSKIEATLVRQVFRLLDTKHRGVLQPSQDQAQVCRHVQQGRVVVVVRVDVAHQVIVHTRTVVPDAAG